MLDIDNLKIIKLNSIELTKILNWSILNKKDYNTLNNLLYNIKLLDIQKNNIQLNNKELQNSLIIYDLIMFGLYHEYISILNLEDVENLEELVNNKIIPNVYKTKKYYLRDYILNIDLINYSNEDTINKQLEVIKYELTESEKEYLEKNKLQIEYLFRKNNNHANIEFNIFNVSELLNSKDNTLLNIFNKLKKSIY